MHPSVSRFQSFQRPLQRATASCARCARPSSSLFLPRTPLARARHDNILRTVRSPHRQFSGTSHRADHKLTEAISDTLYYIPNHIGYGCQILHDSTGLPYWAIIPLLAVASRGIIFTVISYPFYREKQRLLELVVLQRANVHAVAWYWKNTDPSKPQSELKKVFREATELYKYGLSSGSSLSKMFKWRLYRPAFQIGIFITVAEALRGMVGWQTGLIGALVKGIVRVVEVGRELLVAEKTGNEVHTNTAVTAQQIGQETTANDSIGAVFEPPATQEPIQSNNITDNLDAAYPPPEASLVSQPDLSTSLPTYIPEMTHSGILWFPDLTFQDTTLTLNILCALGIYLTARTTFAPSSPSTSSPTAINVFASTSRADQVETRQLSESSRTAARRFMQVLALLFVPMTVPVPSAVMWYWVWHIWLGYGQAVVLRRWEGRGRWLKPQGFVYWEQEDWKPAKPPVRRRGE